MDDETTDGKLSPTSSSRRPEPSDDRNIDLLIVGAGPTGLTLASEALRHGLHCRIIDRSPAPSRTSIALAIQSRTIEVFESIGVADELLARGQRLTTINLYVDGHRLGRFTMERPNGPYPFILVLEQSETERILAHHIESLGLRIERQVELLTFVEDGEQVVASLRGPDGREEIVQAAWLAGCDGAHSKVRHELGLPFEGAAYEEEFILGDLRVAWSLPQDQAYGFLSSGKLLAFFPMRGDHRYRLVATRYLSNITAGQEPTLAEFQSLVNERVPVEAKLTDPVWLAAFVLHRRIVQTMKQGRVFLVGDAAHIHSPAGGQGMNTGIQDAHNLAWKLALVATGRAHPNLLDSYDAERRPVSKAVLRGTDLAFRSLLGQNQLSRISARLLAQILIRSVRAQRSLSKSISELDVNYRKSPIIRDYPRLFGAALRILKPSTRAANRGITNWMSSWKDFRSGPAAGERAPDGVLRTPLGESLRLFDLLRNTKHQLLIFTGTLEKRSRLSDELTALACRVRQLYADQISVYVIIDEDKPSREIRRAGFVLFDPSARLTKRYGCTAPGIFLLRPDGYIAFRSQEADSKRLLDYLSKIFTEVRNTDCKKVAA